MLLALFVTALGQIAESATGYRLIVEKSTVPVETGRRVKETLEIARGKKIQLDVTIMAVHLGEPRPVPAVPLAAMIARNMSVVPEGPYGPGPGPSLPTVVLNLDTGQPLRLSVDVTQAQELARHLGQRIVLTLSTPPEMN